MFTLAIEIGNPRTILELLKNLCTMSPGELEFALEIIPLEDLLSLKNAYVEPLLKYAMVPAISDRGFDPPVVFNQSETTVNYAHSS